MTILRVVFYGEEHPHYTITKSFEKQFSKVVTIWWEQYDVYTLNQNLIERVRKGDIDVVFMQIQKENVIFPETARIMSQHSLVFNWTGDVRRDLNAYTQIGKYVVTLFTNMNDVITMRGMGFKSEYLQVGYDHQYYYNKKLNREPQIVFCGNYYEQYDFPLKKERQDMVVVLQKEFGDRFKLFGGSWEKVGVKSNGVIKNYDEAKIYNESLIAINYSHFNYSRYFSDRLLREMACGCLVISHNFIDYQDEFEDRKHLVIANDLNDMIKLCDYYLKNSLEAIKIGNTASDFVVEKYQWTNFAQNFNNIINKYKKQNNLISNKMTLINKDENSNEPLLMPFQNMPFNGDNFICQEFLKLKSNYKINVAIETGSCLYTTTQWLSDNFDYVYTAEINMDYAKHGYYKIENKKNVSAYITDSVEFMQNIFDNEVKSEDNCILFLDAHWGDFCPLLEELESINKIKTTQPPIITIHDFYTGNNELGYDTYKGQAFTYDWIKPQIKKLEFKFNCEYDYYYNEHSEGAKRGMIYLIPKI